MTDYNVDMQDDEVSLSSAVSDAVNNITADVRIEKVIASWDHDSAMQKQVKIIIMGYHGNHIKTGRVDKTTKIGFEFTGKTRKDDKDNFDTPFDYYGGLPKGRVDVPVDWLSATNLPMLFTDDSTAIPMNRISFWRLSFMTGGAPEWEPQVSLNGDKGSNKWLLKLMIMGQSSKSRKTWNSRFMTMGLNPGYRANCAVKTGDIITDAPVNHVGFISEEKANDGMFNVIRSTSIFGVPAKGGYVLCEEPKKANARETKLFKQGDAISLGEQKFVVLADVPEALSDYFVAGQLFAPSSLLGRIGVHRGKGPIGIKGASMPYPDGWEEVLPAGAFLASKNSFKSARNGVAKLLTGLSYKDMTKCLNKKASKEARKMVTDVMDAAEQTYILDGIAVKGWEIEAEYLVSNLYALYGVRTIEEAPNEDDWYGELDLDDEEGGSFYTEQSELLKINADHDIIMDLKIGLDDKSIKYINQSINLKMQEFNNIYWTHGADVAHEFLENVVDASIKRMKESTKFALDLFADTTYDMVEFGEADLQRIQRKVYGSVNVQVGRLDPTEFGNEAHGQKVIDYLLYGDKDDSNDRWDGIFGKTNKLFSVKGQEFLIPNGKIIKEYGHDEKGSDRWFLSGPAQAFQMLIAAWKNPKTDWTIKSINHNMDLQRDLFGKNIDGFAVEGFGNKVILPAWWLRHDVIACIDPTFEDRDGDIVMGSKMPVIFDGAVDGFIYRTTIPTSVFGDLDARMELALRNAVFVNIPTLLALRNDADGDIHRIAFIGGVPLRKLDNPKHTLEWVDTYTKGEYDMELKYKDYSLFLPGDVHDGIVEAADNKAYVGIGTNDLNMLGHFLQVFVSKRWMKYADAKLLRSYYSFGLQDYIVGGIKHKSGNTALNLFKLGNLKEVLMNSNNDSDEAMIKAIARKHLKTMIAGYSENSCDAIPALDRFLNVWDQFSGMSKVGYTPLAARRVSSIVKHDYSVISNENHMKELDIFTRSAVNNAHSSQPYPYMKNSYNPKIVIAFDNCMVQLDNYKNKYVLLEQVMPVHADTMIGYLKGYWKEVSEQAYVDSHK